MVLKHNFNNLFQTQFSNLRNWIGSIDMSMRDNTCVASFVKIGSGIEELIVGNRQTDRERDKHSAMS
jgi:hypothetical protein